MSSTQPRKQRRAAAEAPWHRKHKTLSAHVDPALRKKRDWTIPRAVPVRKGDTVVVLRGSFRGTKGKVISVDVNNGNVTLENVKIKKRDEKEVSRPVHASNLMIVSLNVSDPRRRERLHEERES